MNTALLCFLPLYGIPLMVSWIDSIVYNWKDIHTIGDFLFPLDREDNFLIWFPFLNIVYCCRVLIWLIQKFLNIQIKK